MVSVNKRPVLRQRDECFLWQTRVKRLRELIDRRAYISDLDALYVGLHLLDFCCDFFEALLSKHLAHARRDKENFVPALADMLQERG